MLRKKLEVYDVSKMNVGLLGMWIILTIAPQL